MAHILIVEDDFDIQELLQNYLENEGYQVTIASDGEEALEKFHQESADLILLDLMLPKLDGYSVCKAIRQESDVSIIMLTALDGEWNQLKGFDLQIDDYITKPFSIPIL
ncbi:MAG: response regulator [Oscillospiraceae bacterium]|nr:response regulator [Oscillospiraceae bacterium]